jgi:hypothetical protein
VTRIFYVSHDIARPSGGINIMHEHVRTLCRHGFEARILQGERGFRYPFVEPVPVAYAEDVTLDDGDFLVVPEDHSGAIRACPTLRGHKVLFCQNHYYVFQGLPAGDTWTQLGFEAFLCLSEPIRRALQAWFGVDAHVVRPAIDARFFAAEPCPISREIIVACMPRKGAAHLQLVRGLLESGARRPMAHLEWMPIDGLKKDEVAARLRSAHLFVSTSVREGLGLPPLEAMAAGCLVVGFAGGGGLEYATAENGIWVQDEDPWALADAVKESADALAAGSLIATRAAGGKTASSYSQAAFEERLLAFWHDQFRVHGFAPGARRP